MKPITIVFILGLLSCSTKKNKSEEIVKDSINNHQYKSITDLKKTDPDSLKDGALESLSGKFKISILQINQVRFDSLFELVKETEIPLIPFKDLTTKTDSCTIIRFLNNKSDTLCNKKEGDYYENYSIKGYWKEKELLFVNFENWEDNDYFFINLLDGSRYDLSPSNKLSPDLKLVLSFADVSAYPTYSGGFTITNIEQGAITTIFNKEFIDWTVKEAYWISNNQCLLVTTIVDYDADETKDARTYLINID